MNIEEYPASTYTYTQGRGGKSVEYIVVHYTSSEASARNNCAYFAGGNRNASAHIFLDGEECLLSVPLADTAWACGNFDFNQRSVSIEVCAGNREFDAAERAQLRECVQWLMARFDVPAGRVCRHHDCYSIGSADGVGGSWIDPGKACPAWYVDDGRWQSLWAYITGGHDLDTGGEPEQAASIDVDGWWGCDTTRALQERFACVADGEVWHQWADNVDGNPALTTGWCSDETQEGSPVIRALQHYMGMADGKCDGLIGPTTVATLQAFLGCVKDGVLDGPSPCVMELQRRLNAGTF